MQTYAVLEVWWKYIQDGGFVMPPLVAGTLVLWFCLGWRMMTMRRGSTRTLAALLDMYCADPDRHALGIMSRATKRTAELLEEKRADVITWYLEEEIMCFEQEMSRYRVVVTSIVAAAPLTGLLGTVTGMIETFDSLADMSLFSQSGGVAGGIAQALITTQMGLVIAIPGLIVGRMLDRKQERLLEELDALKHLAATRAITQRREVT